MYDRWRCRKKIEELSEKCKLSHDPAASRVRGAGIGISSSGNCSNRNNPRCTSLEQVNCKTIDGIVRLKGASGCPITITGGTETGHAGGDRSHWNGFKLDFALNNCINTHIKTKYRKIGNRGSYEQWQEPNGTIHCLEGNHWDSTFV